MSVPLISKTTCMIYISPFKRSVTQSNECLFRVLCGDFGLINYVFDVVIFVHGTRTAVAILQLVISACGFISALLWLDRFVLMLSTVKSFMKWRSGEVLIDA